MRGRYQGGSLAGFIIIGAVLVLVLVGGLYGLNRYNAEQSKEVATDQKDGSNEQSNDKNSSESDSKSDQSTPESTNEESQNEAANEAYPAAGKDESSEDELPATGPADTIAAIVAVVALGFATTHYLQSRSQNHR